MDHETRQMLESMGNAMERMENMLHRALHGSEPNTAGIYKRLDRIESDVGWAKSAVKWVGSIVSLVVGAIAIKVFGGGGE